MAGTSGSVDVPDVVAAPLGVRARHVLLAAAEQWTPPPGAVLLAVTVSVLGGTATVVDADGTSAAGLPAGLSASWGVEHDADTLDGPSSITAAAGSQVYVHWTERA